MSASPHSTLAFRLVVPALAGLCACLPWAAGPSSAATKPSAPETVRQAAAASEYSGMVWYVEAADGTPVDARGADEPVNPASVVKLATTLWALERLGPEHRFETRFDAAGSIDAEAGVLHGDLVVIGGGDLDFHVENASLVARVLNDVGIRDVHGALRVTPEFAVGWEGGSERRERDPALRMRAMGSRLRNGLDPARWDRGVKQAMAEFFTRRGLDASRPPAVKVRDGLRAWNTDGATTPVAIHASNPLRITLRRLNAWSNNDIERLEPHLGPPPELQALLAKRLPPPGDALRISTLSGLGTNRMTPRQIVALLGELDRAARDAGLRIEDLLPVAGCGPGTLESFVGLGAEGFAGTVTAKTGTLTTTDGGVVVLAGFARTATGRLAFAVAATRTGRTPAAARTAQERWMLERIAAAGGPGAGACPGPPVHSDFDARVRPLRTGGGGRADVPSAEAPGSVRNGS